MIDLYTYETSNAQRAAIMLEECKLAYTAHRVDLDKDEQRSPAFLKINPAGQIPVIVDRDGRKPIVVAQSAAIILYLAEKSGKLLPKRPAERAAALQWMMKVMTDIAPASTALFYVGAYVPDATAKTKRFLKDRLIAQFRDCDRQLGQTEFLAGKLSVADVALYPTVATRRSIIDKAGGMPNLVRWATAMAARRGVQRGMKAPS